jgi:hypothetical protein
VLVVDHCAENVDQDWLVRLHSGTEMGNLK